MDIVTLGEAMVCLTSLQPSPLQYAPLLEKRVAGAESNVAIAMAKLGFSAGWISRVGEDPLGCYLRSAVRAEGVDVSAVRSDAACSTGVMFKDVLPGRETQVMYYRANSAASHLGPQDLDQALLDSCRILHLSGINFVLSESCSAAALEAARLVRQNGGLVSFDPNLRRKLGKFECWKERSLQMLELSDIVLLGAEEALALLGTAEEDAVFARLSAKGVRWMGLKLGAQGSFAAAGNTLVFCEPFRVSCVDTVGAGDAYDAGFLAGLLMHQPIDACGRMGNAMGALAVTTKGDYEGLPSRRELLNFVSGIPEIAR